MPEKIKYLISLAIVILFIFACGSNKSDKDADKNKEKVTTPKTDPVSKDQYHMVEMFDNDQTQMIDLIEGKANFAIVFEGEGNFKATVLYTDGSVLDLLADVNGNYKGKKTISVPKTTAYVLDVKCKGKWSVYRE